MYGLLRELGLSTDKDGFLITEARTFDNEQGFGAKPETPGG